MESRRMHTRSQPMSPSGFMTLENAPIRRGKKVQRAASQNPEDAEKQSSGTAATDPTVASQSAPGPKPQRRTQRKNTAKKNTTTRSDRSSAEKTSDSGAENGRTTESATSASPEASSETNIDADDNESAARVRGKLPESVKRAKIDRSKSKNGGGRLHFSLYSIFCTRGAWRTNIIKML